MSLKEYYTEREVYQKISKGRLLGILDLVGNLDGKHILDIGCGGGELGRLLKQKFDIKIIGADISDTAVAEAQKILDDAVVYNCETDVAAPEVVKNQTYDFVILSEVLEHLFRPEDALKHIRSFHSESLIITVPNILFWKNRLKICFGSFEYTDSGLMDRGHIHFFSWESLEQLCIESGYSIVEKSHHIPTRGTKKLGEFFPGLFAQQFIIKITPKA